MRENNKKSQEQGRLVVESRKSQIVTKNDNRSFNSYTYIILLSTIQEFAQ